MIIFIYFCWTKFFCLLLSSINFVLFSMDLIPGKFKSLKKISILRKIEDKLDQMLHGCNVLKYKSNPTFHKMQSVHYKNQNVKFYTRCWRRQPENLCLLVPATQCAIYVSFPLCFLKRVLPTVLK